MLLLQISLKKLFFNYKYKREIVLLYVNYFLTLKTTQGESNYIKCFVRLNMKVLIQPLNTLTAICSLDFIIHAQKMRICILSETGERCIEINKI